MTSIDFYILPDSEPVARTLFACRLAEKVYKQGRQIYIHTANEEHAKEVDQQLWAFRADAFVPHQIANQGDSSAAKKAPITIGYGEQGAEYEDVLINLDTQVPDFFSSYQRILEIVVQEAEILASTRQNYKLYQDKGYPLKYQDMRR